MDTRANVLLQIWQDYYDEILDVNLDSGTYESLISTDGKSNRKGFIDIEVMITAKKFVHPDDRRALLEFFDQRKILDSIKKNTFVHKLNFRMHRGDEKYFWVKVKGIMPSRKVGEDTRYFACFRILDNKSDEDMSYRQMLKATVLREKEIGEKRRQKLEKYAVEMRTPISGILGVIDMAKNSPWDEKKSKERIEKVEKEAQKILSLIEKMYDECGKEDVEESSLDEKKLEEIISWGKSSVMMRKHSEENLEGVAGLLEDDYELGDEDEELDEGEATESKAAPKKRKKKAVIPKAGDYNFEGKRFLVVEDDELSADITREMIELTGAQVEIASTGQDAVKMFIANPVGYYDAVLVNLVLNDIDGYSVTRCIRLSCKDDASSVIIIAASPMSMKDSSTSLKENKINGFISKPIDFGMLFMRLGQIWPQKAKKES